MSVRVGDEVQEVSRRMKKRCEPVFEIVGRRLCLQLAFLFSALIVASPASAQCRAADDSSGHMIADLKQLAIDSQEVFQRRDLKIPVVDTATIVLVQQAEVCKRALAAFLTTVPADYPTPLPSAVYVVKVGDVFVAMHPSERVFVYAVMDSRFKVLSKYGR